MYVVCVSLLQRKRMKIQNRKKLFLSIILQVNICITVYTSTVYVSASDTEKEETAPHGEQGMEVSPGKCLPLCM